ncbi:hypothetical protein K458DRAFT_417913 [Lentithecium fluviatile CBS 122367]|uniref:Extracellular mutant protein 11 C-terminal domain-containing protein n=1 Tax=Lentithecium fluviatile CBS 122367 TaxID=1168545 RepID=A0A6G1J298_9PLEO|nr:hypothetical protein K458DRAFT_417913 [Lentithecium fluviatile CBS 122367]
MRGFVQHRGRSGSPQMGESAPALTRAQRAVHARVPTKAAASAHQRPGQQNSSARRQSGNALNTQAAPLPNPQRRRSGESQGRGHDRYDTDAESLDTTAHGQSVLQVENSQTQGRQQYPANETDYSGSEEGSEDDEYQDDQNLPSFQACIDHYKLHGKSRKEQEDFLIEEGCQWYDDGNSYPTTTSGPPDEFPDNWTVDDELPSSVIKGRSSPSPVQPSANGQPTLRTGQQAVQRGQQVLQHQQAMPKQSAIFHQSAAIRENQRTTTTNVAMRGGGQYQANAHPPPTSQPPTYSQSNREPALPANSAHRLAPATQANPFAPHSTRQPVGQPVNYLREPTEPSVPIPRATPARPKEEPVARPEPIIQPPVIEPQPAPIEDYDDQILFNKTYDELKAEDFDTVPRGKPQVLSEDMIQKPLEERLDHVHKHLDTGDQDKFFRALPTREWEEAGDWFLEKFSDIIKRTKEARQKKRKLASDFEDEIEKRYRHVAKRQQQVQDALEKMKAQGEGLVPKSPRPSKSPRK